MFTVPPVHICTYIKIYLVNSTYNYFKLTPWRRLVFSIYNFLRIFNLSEGGGGTSKQAGTRPNISRAVTWKRGQTTPCTGEGGGAQRRQKSVIIPTWFMFDCSGFYTDYISAFKCFIVSNMFQHSVSISRIFSKLKN